MFKKLIQAIRNAPDAFARQLQELSGEAAEERRRLILRAVEPSLSYREARVQVGLAISEAKGRSSISYEDAFETFVSIMGVGYRSGVAIQHLRSGLTAGLVQDRATGRAWAQLLAAGWDRDAFLIMLEARR